MGNVFRVWGNLLQLTFWSPSSWWKWGKEIKEDGGWGFVISTANQGRSKCFSEEHQGCLSSFCFGIWPSLVESLWFWALLWFPPRELSEPNSHGVTAPRTLHSCTYKFTVQLSVLFTARGTFSWGEEEHSQLQREELRLFLTASLYKRLPDMISG